VPKRTREHEIEQLSKIAFDKSIPTRWVVRNKVPDYGTDLEVEVFDEDGSSTGIVFLVQLKATDNTETPPKVRLKVDHLNYFNSLELPTLLIRYLAANDSLWAKWHFEIHLSDTQKSQESITVDFDLSEQWSYDSAARIKETLIAIKAWKSAIASTRIHLVLADSRTEHRVAHQLKKVIESICDQLPIFVLRPTGNNVPRISVLIDNQHLVVSAGSLGSNSHDLPSFDNHNCHTTILYSLVMLLGRLTLDNQAKLVAEFIRDSAVKIDSRELSCHAAMQVRQDMTVAVDIALLNGVHQKSDEVCIGFLLWLHSAPSHLRQESSITKFVTAMLEFSHSKGKPAELAGAYYSLANRLNNTVNSNDAFRYFNKARKLLPDYLSRSYFLREVGGLLFKRGKYSISTCSYLRSIELDANEKAIFCSGDALLFSGRVAEALTRFRNFEQLIKPEEDPELSLKLLVCEWLLRVCGTVVPVRTQAARNELQDAELRNIPSDQSLWTKALELDAFCEVANFNLATREFRDGNFSSALVRFLICALRVQVDVEAWKYAIAAALRHEGTELFTNVLVVSSKFCGRQPYDEFRDRTIELGLNVKDLESLDSVFEMVRADLEKNNSLDFTLRDVNSGEELIKVAEIQHRLKSN
jgi:tetratricopeptide (TPR) repeat protein